MLKGNMPEGEGPGTVVGVNVALSGTLKDQNDISVHGMVEGEVVSEKTVTVGQTAQVKGPVRGKIITVAGVIRGSIDASEKLEVLETGKIFGSVTTRDMVVRSGAQISGKVTMGLDEDEAAKPQADDVTPEPIIDEASQDPTNTEETNGEEPTLKPDEE